jgi:hypothetical protein
VQAAGTGGNRGAVVQSFTNFKGKIMLLLKVQCSTVIEFGVTKKPAGATERTFKRFGCGVANSVPYLHWFC